MLDDISLQKALASAGFYKGKIDGDIGPMTREAMRKMLSSKSINYANWDNERIRIATEQLILQNLGFYPKMSKIDGKVGPNTNESWSRWHNAQRKNTIPPKVDNILSPNPPTINNIWPTQANVPTYYGTKGANQTKIKVPWKMYLAWDTSVPVTQITLHEKVAASATRIFDRIHNEIGESKIHDLGLHLFGGSLNVRRMRGGSSWSMHSWGIAMDFDPERNQLNWGKDKARLGHSDAIPMWKIWEAEGWVSLGRVRNYDWMHVQAARL